MCERGLAGLLLCLLAAGTGCHSLHSGASRPAWINEPKSDDSLYLYRVGHAMPQPTEEAAREIAYQHALNDIAKTVLPRMAGSTVPAALAVGFERVELVPGCTYVERHDAGFEAWVQISWPLAEKQKIIKRIELGDRINGLWAQAQSALNQGQMEIAKSLLADILKGKEQALGVSVDMEAVKLMMGDIHREQRNVLDARACYDSVLNVSTSAAVRRVAADKLRMLPDPPRFWPMHDRWNGQKVALVCVIRDGKDCRRFADLTHVLLKDCGEARLPAVDVALDLDAVTLSNGFDKLDFTVACKAAALRAAGLILAVLYDIDPAKRGTTQVNMGVKIPVPDSVVRFFLVRVADGTIVYNGQFREVAGAYEEPRLADRAAVILVTKYLLPSCPALPRPVGTSENRPAL